MVILGQTDHGEAVQMSRRAAESDLVVYVNINLVSMDGGWKSTATGLVGLRRACKVHHNSQTMRKSTVVHGPGEVRAPPVELAPG